MTLSVTMQLLSWLPISGEETVSWIYLINENWVWKTRTCLLKGPLRITDNGQAQYLQSGWHSFINASVFTGFWISHGVCDSTYVVSSTGWFMPGFPQCGAGNHSYAVKMMSRHLHNNRQRLESTWPFMKTLRRIAHRKILIWSFSSGFDTISLTIFER